MTDPWVTASSLATAGGTLVLAVATFSSVRSANRAAQTAQQSLLVGVRPMLIPSREGDPDERVMFVDQLRFDLRAHGALAELVGENLYLALGVRNAGSGIAVLQGWRTLIHSPGALERPPLEEFTPQGRDIYIPAGESSYWHAAIRDPAFPGRDRLLEALGRDAPIAVDLLYSDYAGAQRSIVRFTMTPGDGSDGRWANTLRYWNVDGEDPR